MKIMNDYMRGWNDCQRLIRYKISQILTMTEGHDRHNELQCQTQLLGFGVDFTGVERRAEAVKNVLDKELASLDLDQFKGLGVLTDRGPGVIKGFADNYVANVVLDEDGKTIKRALVFLSLDGEKGKK
jgi:hypothetical protein